MKAVQWGIINTTKGRSAKKAGWSMEGLVEGKTVEARGIITALKGF